MELDYSMTGPSVSYDIVPCKHFICKKGGKGLAGMFISCHNVNFPINRCQQKLEFFILKKLSLSIQK